MKKSKLIIPLTAVGALATVAAPLFSLTSCGPQKTIVDQMYQAALEHFVGKDMNGGICAIPHSSYHYWDLIQYLRNLVNNEGLNINQDSYGNLWYDIPATKGCENWKPLAVQAHLDMVWAIKDDTVVDYDHPIPVRDTINGKEVIHTRNNETSLGADDGAGMSIILALTTKRDNYQHGKIRCILTCDEEEGMVGASKIGQMRDGTVINVVDHNEGFDYMLNLDAENEGEYFVSCAGGYNCEYRIKEMPFEPITNDFLYRLSVKDCMGGHSGGNIHLNPINAPKFAGELIEKINAVLDANGISHVKLVNMVTHKEVGNVLPENTDVIVAAVGELKGQLDTDIRNALDEALAQAKQDHPNEKDVKYELVGGISKEEYPQSLNVPHSDLLLDFLKSLKFGPVFDESSKRLVSSANVCPFELQFKPEKEQDPQFKFRIFDRSENEDYLETEYITFTRNKFRGFVEGLGKQQSSSINEISHYPAYVYKEQDKIRDEVIKSYRKMGITPSEQRTHGGIECAWWYRYNKNIHQTSIGPTIIEPHSNVETLYLDTYKNCVAITLDVVAAMQNIQ